MLLLIATLNQTVYKMAEYIMHNVQMHGTWKEIFLNGAWLIVGGKYSVIAKGVRRYDYE